MNLHQKINIIQLMKPQKQAKQKRQAAMGLPVIQNNGFNQTIIINNPNFNINYIDHAGYNVKPNSRQNNHKNIQEPINYDPKNSSKGIDAWSLNKNLKEFSETRQLGFFKADPSKTKSNVELQQSPYLSHKTKTQEIKPFTKIKPSIPIQPSFRENRTISTIKYQTIASTQRDHSSLSHANNQNTTLDIYDQSKPSFRRKRFQSKTKHPKSNIQDLSDATLEPYLKDGLDLSETIPNHGSRTQRKITPLNLKTRRNRFIESELKQVPSVKKISENESEQNVEDLQNSLIIDSPKKLKNNIQSHSSKISARKRVYQKSIQKISKCFLSKVDNYFDQNRNAQLPSSKIQLYATTVQQPSSYSFNIDYKSSPLEINSTQYDFEFEEQKPKHRPKTPYKRKKMYQQIS